MFIERKEELKILEREFSKAEKSAILIYGKRRVGKSTLIIEAAKSFNGVVINHIAAEGASYEICLDMLSYSITKALSLPEIKFSSILDIFEYLNTRKEKILLVIDEYQYLKDSLPAKLMDSYIQIAIDRLNDNIKLVLCGSYITIMRELMEEENPLFGRFSSIIHLKPFDYYSSSLFFPNSTVRDKIALYSIFGGSPYILSLIDSSLSLEDNIKELFLKENSPVRVHIENILFKELKKAFDIGILEIIGNGKKKYSEIATKIDVKKTGNLDKQLKKLIDADVIEKVSPINRKDDKKKAFYTISDNLLRFYFSFIFMNRGRIQLLGVDRYFEAFIKRSLNTFISYRFEGIVCEYLARMVKKGKYPTALNIGTYWYDDPKNKVNGEFDCVLEETDGYSFYEAKYYENPLSEKQCNQEAEQVMAILDMSNKRIGFVSASGFDFESDKYELITGDDLFSDINGID